MYNIHVYYSCITFTYNMDYTPAYLHMYMYFIYIPFIYIQVCILL